MQAALSLSFPWWSVPLAIVAAGYLVASWRARCYPDDDLLGGRSVVFIFWFCMFAAAAVGFAGACVLLG